MLKLDGVALITHPPVSSFTTWSQKKKNIIDTRHVGTCPKKPLGHKEQTICNLWEPCRTSNLQLVYNLDARENCLNFFYNLIVIEEILHIYASKLCFKGKIDIPHLLLKGVSLWFLTGFDFPGAWGREGKRLIYLSE